MVRNIKSFMLLYIFGWSIKVQWRIHLIVVFWTGVCIVYSNNRKSIGGIINCVLHIPCQVNYKKTFFFFLNIFLGDFFSSL
jgi:hypothetical protein